MAEDFSKTHKSRTKYKSGNEYRDNEFEYWSLVEDPKCKKIRKEVLRF
jgi:predicted secreted Zn-dependent protease